MGATVMVGDRQRPADGDGLLYASCDVTDVADIEGLMSAAVSKMGNVDMWVNNAGLEIETSFRPFGKKAMDPANRAFGFTSREGVGEGARNMHAARACTQRDETRQQRPSARGVAGSVRPTVVRAGPGPVSPSSSWLPAALLLFAALPALAACTAPPQARGHPALAGAWDGR